jgi:hypothetical protein
MYATHLAISSMSDYTPRTILETKRLKLPSMRSPILSSCDFAMPLDTMHP